jgi:hypothetical protein
VALFIECVQFLVIVLQLTAGPISLIWLLLLGRADVLCPGIALMICAPIAIAIAMFPIFVVELAAGIGAHHNRRDLETFFATCVDLYAYAIVGCWGVILGTWYPKVLQNNWERVPMLLWIFELATVPVMILAVNAGDSESAGPMVTSFSLAMILLLSVLAAGRSWSLAITVYLAVMGLGAVFVVWWCSRSIARERVLRSLLRKLKWLDS